jgi:hypothetical protein
MILEDRLARDSMTTSSLYFLKLRDVASSPDNTRGIKRKWDETFLTLPETAAFTTTTTMIDEEIDTTTPNPSR